MKKIFGNNEAVARNVAVVAVIAVLIIIAAGIAYVYTGSGSTEYWETPAEFGMWQDELTLTFADGSTESFKIIEEGSKPFTVYYDGKEITHVAMRLSAKATATGYTGARIKTTNFGYKGYIKKGTTTKHSWTAISTEDYIIRLDETEYLTGSSIYLHQEINLKPDKYPSGTYTISFNPTGTVQYQGFPDDPDWKTASLPPSRTITITVDNTPPAQIVVTLSSEAETS